VVLGSKSDMDECARQVTLEEGRAMAHFVNADLWSECSSKTGARGICPLVPVWLAINNNPPVQEIVEQMALALAPESLAQPVPTTYADMDDNSAWVRPRIPHDRLLSLSLVREPHEPALHAGDSMGGDDDDDDGSPLFSASTCSLQ
jgi:hypothetical protein